MRIDHKRRHDSFGPRHVAATAVAVALLAGLLHGCTADQPSVRIGLLVDCVGAARNAQDVVLAGGELPLLERGARLRGARPSDGVTPAIVAGRSVELVTGCTEGGEYTTIIEESRRLAEDETVDVVVGGTWPGDGLALREVARRHLRTAFVVAAPGPREVTLEATAANAFRFAPDFSQQVAGLGTYAFKDLGWRDALVIAEDNEVGWGGAAAFLAEFCALGGRATQYQLPSFGLTQQAPSLPTSGGGVAVFASSLLIPDALATLATGRTAWGSTLVLGPGIGQSPDHLQALPANPHGVATVAPAYSPETQASYVAAYTQRFPGMSQAQAMQPWVLAYHDAVEAIMTGLERSSATAGADGRALHEALGSAEANLVGGRIRLDTNRAAVVSTNVLSLGGIDLEDVRVVRTVPEVDQSLGGVLPATYEPTSGKQPCRAATPPPWAR
jgi:branched-chain amino acid transport system substrate-binding protein